MTETHHPLVMTASDERYTDARDDGEATAGVEIDARDEVEIQELISAATVGARGLYFALVRMPPGSYHLKHHHPDGSEYYYFTKGECTVSLDGADVRARPGTAIYIPADCIHSVLNDTGEVAEFVCGLSEAEYRHVGLVYDE